MCQNINSNGIFCALHHFFYQKYLVVSKNGRNFAPQKRKKLMPLLPVNGVVVQLVRIPACHAGGRGFESRPYRKRREENEKC